MCVCEVSANMVPLITFMGFMDSTNDRSVMPPHHGDVDEHLDVKSDEVKELEHVGKGIGKGDLDFPEGFEPSTAITRPVYRSP